MSYYPVSLDKVKDKAARITGETLKLPLYIIPAAGAAPASAKIKKLTNSFGETITRIDSEIPLSLEPRKDERFLFTSFERTAHTHAIGEEVISGNRYHTALTPELTRWLLNLYSKPGDIVLVPYPAGGSINLEALMNKRHSVGIDSDPFARLVARVKTTPINGMELNRSMNRLITDISNYIPALVATEDIPLFPFRDKWYDKEILHELAYIKNELERQWVSSAPVNFYKICFSSILRAVSNYDVNGMGRWAVKPSKKIYPSAALVKFAESLLINSLRIMNFSNICPDKVITEFPEDADPKNIKYPDGYFNLAMASLQSTGPVDFMGLQPPEIYWLGMAPPRTFMDYGANENPVITEYGRYRYKAKKSELIPGKIFGIDITTAYLTYKYLEDMRANMEEVYRTLEPGGKYVIAAGNFRIRGQSVESFKYIVNIARQVGFKILSSFISENLKDFMKHPESERTPDRIIVLEK
ncbi:MAG: hypothetical protein ACHQJ4_07650 [Ignavibacteria bacterium]